MKVYLVGTSCTWFKRNNTSFVVDDNILIDTPEGSYKDILKYIGDIFKINAIFISHIHSDHFLDLHIFAIRFLRESEKKGRKTKLKIYGPKGTAEKLVALDLLLNGSPDETNLELIKTRVDFIEYDTDKVYEEGEYKIKPFSVDHGGVESYGFTFEDKNGFVCGFSGDTKDCEGLRNILKHSKVCFVDMAAKLPHKSHLDVERFLELSNEFQDCKMIPIHTSDETQKFAVENNLNYVNDGDTLYF